jgi:tRNA(fMet)-specific endonuclease VapC
MAVLEEFLSRFELLDYPVAAADAYGSIRVSLEKAGQPIGGNDLMIAAHALTIDARLVTRNLGEFERVRGLKVVDWAA